MILARHGLRHTLPPTAVNYRTNIRALKDAGCTAIPATNYNCWKTDEPPVEWGEVLRIFGMNAENVKKLLLETIGLL